MFGVTGGEWNKKICKISQKTTNKSVNDDGFDFVSFLSVKWMANVWLVRQCLVM